jgi:hypothetical protein
MAGQTPPAKTIPASSPTLRLTARAVVGSRARPPPATTPRAVSAALGLLHQDAMLERPLQLLGQLRVDGGGRGGPQQAGHHPGMAPKAATSRSSSRAAQPHTPPRCRSGRRPVPPAHSRPPATGPPPAPGRPGSSATRPPHPGPPPGAARASDHAGGRPQLHLHGLGPLGLGVGGAGPGQQLLLADQHEPGPIGLKQQLGRASTTCWRAAGKPSLGPGWSGCRCSWPGRPVRCASPLSSSLEIASHEGPRLAGAEGARPEATRQWQRWPDPSIARPAIGCDAERRLGWAQVGREGPGVAASGMTVVARPLTLIACSRPEAATPARATLGEAGQQPPERLLTAPLPAPQLADPKEFSAAGWAVSVAYAGHPWKHVPCQSWC